MSQNTEDMVLKKSRSMQSGIGKGAAIFLAIVVVCIVFFGFKVLSNPAPNVRPVEPIEGIGISRHVAFAVTDAHYRIKRVGISVLQNGHTFNVPVTLEPLEVPKQPREYSVQASAEIGRRSMPELEQGTATIRVVAVNGSWGRFLRGGQRVLRLSVPVRFMPPQVQVLTSQQYIYLGGCDLVVFSVSEGTVSSGVQVGKYYFPSWPVKEGEPQTRLCLFAFPYDVDASTSAHIVAVDDAGNRTIAGFNYKVFPVKFPASTLTLAEAFLQRVVPPIMSQTTAIRDQGSLAANFVEINRDLRRMDSDRLVQFSRHTNSKLMWTQPFLRQPNAKNEGGFADARTYKYDGKIIDHEVHLGDDLASVQHAPVMAANSGLVIYAGWLDIFGNAVIIDHGCGLQSLYGHMASFKVKAGELVKRGQVIGVSDSTGLAGGDHVHYEMLLDGVPVDPKEWWDPHWIHDRITTRLARY
jgi:hypothetical protein